MTQESVAPVQPVAVSKPDRHGVRRAGASVHGEHLDRLRAWTLELTPSERVRGWTSETREDPNVVEGEPGGEIGAPQPS